MAYSTKASALQPAIKDSIIQTIRAEPDFESTALSVKAIEKICSAALNVIG